MLMILILLSALMANIFKLLTVLPVNEPSMNIKMHKILTFNKSKGKI